MTSVFDKPDGDSRHSRVSSKNHDARGVNANDA
jgi:hypothetical protein